VSSLTEGREAYARRAWLDAYTALSEADRETPLEAADLELLAMSAAMIGRMDEHLVLLERLHQRWLDAEKVLRAARAAFMVGMMLTVRGEVGPAGGWFARTQRLVDRAGGECAEAGLLRVPLAYRLAHEGDFEAAFAAAAEAAECAERFGEPDLLAISLHIQGLIRIKEGRVEEGLELLDEAMVCVTAGEVSPFLSGVVYCGVIASCEEAFDPRRAREWTNALARWCEEQPQLVSYTGRCLAHRAGIMQLHGRWQDALEEARLARVRCEEGMNRAAAGQAYYQQGELHRLRGELNTAEAASTAAAAAAIRRALSETKEPLQRAVLLPAYVEILLATGEVAEARDASRELEETAASGRPMLRALAAHVRGAVELAEGDAEAALVSARDAWKAWEELEAPYEAARARVLVGIACRELGDLEGAALPLDAAARVFDRLGAAPELARLASLSAAATPDRAHGLTGRELEVLKLVAAGKTNREIAAELVVSEHTVARHLQNIFAKLGVSSRTSATAFAFEHELV
jgi:DNA-binding CsgD family transcriptional regulator